MHTEAEKERQIGSQRHTQRWTNRDMHIHTEAYRGIQMHREAEKERQIGRQRGGDTDRGSQLESLILRQRQTDRDTDTEREIQTQRDIERERW